MKKAIAMILAMAACFTMAACGKEAAPSKQPATADVVKAVADTLTFKDTMVTVDAQMISNFYRIDSDKVAEISMYTSGTRATAEEVTVIKMKDAGDIKLAESAMAERVEDQKIAYENYVPEEMTKINGALVLTQGNYALLVMADDTAPAENAFKAQF